MKISLLKADITEIKTDAIVNAANSSLLGGGGVDGAIHRKGGPQILEDCKEIRQTCGECPPGQAVITRAGELPAKNVIHTVGPIWKGGDQNEADTLASCYRNSIQLALDNQLHRIAFPNISTGVYRFPKDQAAEIAIKTVQEFEDHPDLEEVVFVCFDEENYNLYKGLLE
jgi:O-acetyl-ADP-ribose deacetylase (regulator of RNase III)